MLCRVFKTGILGGGITLIEISQEKKLFFVGFFFLLNADNLIQVFMYNKIWKTLTPTLLVYFFNSLYFIIPVVESNGWI